MVLNLKVFLWTCNATRPATQRCFQTFLKSEWLQMDISRQHRKALIEEEWGTSELVLDRANDGSCKVWRGGCERLPLTFLHPHPLPSRRGATKPQVSAAPRSKITRHALMPSETFLTRIAPLLTPHRHWNILTAYLDLQQCRYPTTLYFVTEKLLNVFFKNSVIFPLCAQKIPWKF